MDDCKTSVSQKTLMLALDNLRNKAERLDSIAELSNTLKRKMNRTDGTPTGQSKEDAQEGNAKQSDIIDLFNNVSGDIGISISVIEQNLDRVIAMIE